MKKTFPALSGIILSFLFLNLILKNIDFNLLRQSFLKVKFLLLFPVIILTFAEVFLRGLKWKIILSPKIEIGVKDLFRFQVVGLTINNIIPFRIGEIIKGILAAKKYAISYIFIFSTILIERITDMLILFSTFIFIATYNSFALTIFSYRSMLIVPSIIAVLFLLSLIFVNKINSIPLVSAFYEKYPKVKSISERVSDGALCFHNFKTAFFVLLIGFLQWLINAINYYIMAEAFSMADKINFIKAIVLVFISAVAASLPAMPGYFGNIEFAATKVMRLWDIKNETALACAFLSHFINYTTVTVLGLIFICRTGYSLRKLVKDVQETEIIN